MRLTFRCGLLSAPLFTALTLAIVAMSAPPVLAQFPGGGAGGGAGGFGASPFAGVAVDADGVLRRTAANDPTGRLANQRIAEAMSRFGRDLKRPSKLRKVSLNRLEAAIAEAGSPDEVMQGLAGLTRIDYVFCYPAANGEPGDIVIAGPAEPWATAPSGRKLGIKSGAPVLELQDLVTALRLFPSLDAAGEAKKGPLVYCSIDPTQEGLANFQRFVSSTRYDPTRFPSQQQINHYTNDLQKAMGLQTITVGGVSPKTHFAQVLVEADYRMKLIGIGIERPPVRLKNYVDRANLAMVSRNALQRWYFVPDYERIAVSEDGLAMQMVGEGVKLIGEDEFISRDGTRRRTGRSNTASAGFTGAFTKMYGRLAARLPVFAQLRNCIDLAVAAAFMQDRDYYTQADWRPDLFADESRLSVETYNAPQQVDPAVTSRRKGNTLVTPIGGGVQIRPTESLASAKIGQDDGKIATARESVRPEGDHWWWD